jgi:hypothetical protein
MTLNSLYVLILPFFSSLPSLGYSCALAYMDLMDLGSFDSGREADPCTRYQGEVLMHAYCIYCNLFTE